MMHQLSHRYDKLQTCGGMLTGLARDMRTSDPLIYLPCIPWIARSVSLRVMKAIKPHKCSRLRSSSRGYKIFADANGPKVPKVLYKSSIFIYKKIK